MNKKLTIGIGIGVLLIGGATAYYFLVHKKKKEGTRKKDINKDTKATLSEQIDLLCKGETYETNENIAYTTQQLYEKTDDQNKLCEQYGSFDGDMVERYSTNLLGADVFPHSNWMAVNQNPSSSTGEMYEFDYITTEL